VARLQADAGDDFDVLWQLLNRKAGLGGDTAAEEAGLLARDPDPDAGARVFSVRAARADAGEKEAVWQAMADGRFGSASSAGSPPNSGRRARRSCWPRMPGVTCSCCPPWSGAG
jgi:hypothetical protein